MDILCQYETSDMIKHVALHILQWGYWFYKGLVLTLFIYSLNFSVCKAGGSLQQDHFKPNLYKIADFRVMLPSFWMCNLTVIFKCPTGFLLSSPTWSLNLRARAAFQQILSFFPSSKGVLITFSGLWHNLDQSQGLYRVIILTADTPYHTLLPFSTSGSWYKVKSLEVLHCVAGALENVTLLKNPRYSCA